MRVAQAGIDRGSTYPRGDAAWQIRHEGETLGMLTLGVADGERLSTLDRETAARIAAHAGLVLHNARLTIRLVDRVAELGSEPNRCDRPGVGWWLPRTRNAIGSNVTCTTARSRRWLRS